MPRGRVKCVTQSLCMQCVCATALVCVLQWLHTAIATHWCAAQDTLCQEQSDRVTSAEYNAQSGLAHQTV
eukprot:6491735-Amphidinium_carterae.5